MKYIGKILPIEGYEVLLNGDLPVDYSISLTHLYQPLIGMEAIMLYQTLLNDAQIRTETSLHTHHTLMTYLDIPLDQLYEARLKLEGIGLLQTFALESDMNTSYVYKLQAPFSPSSFFQDAMLSELLYHHLGEMKYKELNRRCKIDSQDKLGVNVTASFKEVFQTFQPSFEHEVPLNDQDKRITQTKNSSQIDFSWMKQMLKQRMIPVNSVLTEENKLLISQMMVLYDLEPYEIDKSVLWAISEDHTLDREEFKAACHDLFKAKHNEVPIQLVKNKKMEKTKDRSTPLTKEEQLVETLQRITPKQLLEDLSNGNHASEQDMKIIREVMTKQGLPPAVMNVLIHYVLLQSDMKLSKAYLEKIASHWSRAKLKTAKDAMEFAKKETTKRTKNTYSKRTYYNQAKSTVGVLPDWFKERKQKQKQVPKQSPANQSIDMEEEKEEVLALLRKHAGTTQNNHFQG
ncbi:replication initiation and membrane attachment family protein [Virgibacillus sp. W0430]|uniref:replication initiation and membrane attachment family protein n=1 Tax=Virgibacillus sp. W0430 TaxID=3391580 RepID=UPI003F467F88